MSIVASDLQLWSAANIPVDETSTAGGAISTTTRPTLDQFGANAVVAVISDGTDTRTLTVTGRNAGGAVVTDAIVLTNAVEKLGVVTFERILSAVLSGTDAARTVTIKQGTGGTVRGTIGPNETTRHIAFQQSFSTTSIKNYYEKHFWKNNNGTLTLTVAAIKLTADPSAVITVGCATAINDSGTVANRVTAPAGVTFVDDNISQAVPGNQLATTDKIGVWINMTLAANNAALRSSFTTQLAGQTT